uniref:Uncharacterized protein n=1 Tax=Heterorhabditis bacteriophora TaxID=37862 RepID=A0A1I7XT59_HETBA
MLIIELIPAHPWNLQSTLSPIETSERTLPHGRTLKEGSANIDFTKDTDDHMNEEKNSTESTTHRMETGRVSA